MKSETYNYIHLGGVVIMDEDLAFMLMEEYENNHPEAIFVCVADDNELIH